MSAALDARCLSFNPFEGDRDSRVRVLSDRFVVARYPHDCNICFDRIRPGGRHRARVEKGDGAVATFRFCGTCCLAMAADDHGEAIERRTALGMRRCRKRESESRAGEGRP